jgi:hypothetical protein
MSSSSQRRSSQRRSSSERRRTRRLQTNGSAVAAFVHRFNRSKSFRDLVIAKVHEFGHRYFDSHRSGYVGESDELELLEPLRTYTKEDAIAYVEEFGNEYDEEMLGTAFSDVYRHAIVVDMSNKKHPRFLSVLDPRFAEMEDDYIFTWDGVNQLAKEHPTMLVVTAFTEGAFMLHIPIAS